MLRITKNSKFPNIQDSIDIINNFNKCEVLCMNSWSLGINNIKDEICKEFVDTTLAICEPLSDICIDDDLYYQNVLVKKVEWHTDIGEDITNIYISKYLGSNRYLVINIEIAGGCDFIPNSTRYMNLFAGDMDYFSWKARFDSKGKNYIMTNENLKILLEYIYSNSTNDENNTAGKNRYEYIISKI